MPLQGSPTYSTPSSSSDPATRVRGNSREKKTQGCFPGRSPDRSSNEDPSESSSLPSTANPTPRIRAASMREDGTAAPSANTPTEPLLQRMGVPPVDFSKLARLASPKESGEKPSSLKGSPQAATVAYAPTPRVAAIDQADPVETDKMLAAVAAKRDVQTSDSPKYRQKQLLPSPTSQATRSPQGSQASHLGDTQSALKQAVLGDLHQVPIAQKAAECKFRRRRIGAEIARIDEVLEESRESLRLRPSSRGEKVTSPSYRTCLQNLQWALDHCRFLQGLALSLENHDTGRLRSPVVSQEYASMGLDTILRHDRAQQLLKALRSMTQEENQDGVIPADESPLVAAVSSCGSRACMRDLDMGCNGQRQRQTQATPTKRLIS